MGNKVERYDSLDGFRAFACIGILIMHVLANASYGMTDWISKIFICNLNSLVYFFMIISAFSMCCGYYERFKNKTVDVSTFYKRRYQRTLPFFAVLVVIDLILSFSLSSLMEGFADVTLVFGLLPNQNIEVIGVGWFLGVVFLFYMLFPFFCFLWNKKSTAWISLIVSLLLQVACYFYFMDGNHVTEGFEKKHSFLFVAPYFVVGGILYLYRNEIKKVVSKFKCLFLILTVLATAAYLVALTFVSMGIFRFFVLLVLFCLYMMYAIGTSGKILNNKVTKFLSGISMEIYLCHMVNYRVFEKFNLLYIFGKNWVSCVVACIGVLVLSIVFSLVWKWIIDKFEKFITEFVSMRKKKA